MSERVEERGEGGPRFQEVYGGRFHCDECGASWVGTWHGPKSQLTCLVCKALVFPEKESA